MLRGIKTNRILITSRDSKSVSRYLNEVNKIKVFETPEEEYACSLRAYEGDEEAKSELVTRNLRFVISVAKQYASNNIPLLDLINEGNLALMEAVENFNPTLGFKFISYAVWYIRKNIFEYYSNNSRQIRIPTNKITKMNKIKNKIDDFEQEHGSMGSDSNMLDIFGEDSVDAEILNEINGTMIKSLDNPIDEEGSTTLGSMLEDKSNKGSDHTIVAEHKKQLIESMLNTLSPLEREIITLSFGLNGNSELSLSDIGDKYNLTGESIRLKKHRALGKLQMKTKNLNLSLI